MSFGGGSPTGTVNSMKESLTGVLRDVCSSGREAPLEQTVSGNQFGGRESMN